MRATAAPPRTSSRCQVFPTALLRPNDPGTRPDDGEARPRVEAGGGRAPDMTQSPQLPAPGPGTGPRLSWRAFN